MVEVKHYAHETAAEGLAPAALPYKFKNKK